VKNIQIFDGTDNAVYDVFAVADEEFALIFPDDTDVEFIDEVYQNQPSEALTAAFTAICKRHVPKREAMAFTASSFTSVSTRRYTILRVAISRQSIQTVQNQDSEGQKWLESRPWD
jgi:hypothetical protein